MHQTQGAWHAVSVACAAHPVRCWGLELDLRGRGGAQHERLSGGFAALAEAHAKRARNARRMYAARMLTTTRARGSGRRSPSGPRDDAYPISDARVASPKRRDENHRRTPRVAIRDAVCPQSTRAFGASMRAAAALRTTARRLLASTPRGHPHASRRSLTAVRAMSHDADVSSYSFGPIRIPPTQVFCETALSVGLVNLKPVVPGHVLVITRRVVPRFADLTPDEIADLWTLAKRVGSVLEAHHGATSLTFAIQDGPQAARPCRTSRPSSRAEPATSNTTTRCTTA